MIKYRKRVAFIAIGGVLDAATLASIWLVLNAIGPLQYNTECWLDAIGLTSVPWLVHVVLLPSLIRANNTTPLKLLARTALFISLAAFLIPLIGMTVFFLLGFPTFALLFLVEGGKTVVATTFPIWLERGLWIAVATFVGAPVGLLLHMARPENGIDYLPNSPPNHVRRRSDVLGGMAAAFCAFSGMFIALSLGSFTQPVNAPHEQFQDLSAVPRLPETIVIGVIALMPHLMMIGSNLLAPAGRTERAGSRHLGGDDTPSSD